jgi:thiamine-monophosphate kinase
LTYLTILDDMENSFTAIEEIGEFGLIDRLQTILGEAADSELIRGIGDDAAVFRKEDGLYQVLTTDALIEGVHFDLSISPMSHLGFKCIAVNVSDVVAMNARPRYATIAMGVPHSVSIEMVEKFYSGVRDACDVYGVIVVGGDITAARQLSISVTVVGEVEEKRVAFRRGARPGDLICVTGDLGSGYAGLKVLIKQRIALNESKTDFRSELKNHDYVIQRQLMPRARIDVIANWERAGFIPRDMIDVSDGLASEIHHLCRHSGCGALIRQDSIPIHEQTAATAVLFEDEASNFALFGGEDYELVFATTPGDYSRIDDGSATVVGLLTEAEEGVRMQIDDGEFVELLPGGYQHFG